ncbi:MULTISPECIES: YybH family protein [unclassified Geodermatophilus]
MSRSDVDALNRTLEQALEKGDSALAATIYAPDARLLPPGSEPATGRQIQATWQSFMDMGVSGARLETVSLEERDDLAVEEGRYEMHAGPDTVDAGKYVVVHRRQPDGSWKLAIDIWNSSQSPPSSSDG